MSEKALRDAIRHLLVEALGSRIVPIRYLSRAGMIAMQHEDNLRAAKQRLMQSEREITKLRNLLRRASRYNRHAPRYASETAWDVLGEFQAQIDAALREESE